MDMTYAQNLWEFMETLHNASQLEEVLSSSLDILIDATSSHSGSIWIMEKNSGRAIALMESGSSDNIGESAGRGEGIVGEVCESGETKTVSASEGLSAALAGADSTVITGENILCVPVKTNERTIGCMLLTGKEKEYTEEEQRICEYCCALVAIDIEDRGFSIIPSEEKDPIVSVRGIVKEYQNGEETSRVLKGVDLDVYPGELMIVLGESGCGKSTLLNIIGGMDKKTSGDISAFGMDMSDPSESELSEYRRKYIGFIFQSYNLMPNLTAYENVELIGEYSDEPMDTMETLKLVDLEERADNLPSELSGGQMQRVSIARALVKNPKIILADEPTAALDYDTSIKVLNVIENIVREKKTTVLMVTHNAEIAKMANRVVKLRDGRISSLRVNMQPLKAEELVW